MNELLLYLAKSIIAGALFTGFYQLFMRRESYFVLNRFYLIASALLIIILPLAGSFLLPGIMIASHEPKLPVITLPEVVITSTAMLSPEQESLVLDWMTIIYGIITCALLGGLVLSLVRIGKFIRASLHAENLQDNIYLVPEGNYPFSFNGRIFISKDFIENPALQSIIIHENAHLRQKHIYDLLFIELISSIFWFNPFLFLIKKFIRETHEFLADREVIRQGTEPVVYQQLLFNVVSGNSQYIIANNFNLLTKKRIVMLIKKSKKIAAVRIGILMPVIFTAAIVVAMLQSNRLVAQTTEVPVPPEVQAPPPPPPPPQPPVAVSQEPQKVEKAKAEKKEQHGKPAKSEMMKDDSGNEVFTEVEEPPKFPGGEEARIKYMVSSIKYPDEARKKGVQGTVFITYIVEPDGSITHAKVLRGIGSGCDEEALRVINGMPKWEPGTQKGKAVRVQFNMPIKFALANEGPKPESK
jgi:TonB family protein